MVMGKLSNLLGYEVVDAYFHLWDMNEDDVDDVIEIAKRSRNLVDAMVAFLVAKKLVEDNWSFMPLVSFENTVIADIMVNIKSIVGISEFVSFELLINSEAEKFFYLLNKKYFLSDGDSYIDKDEELKIKNKKASLSKELSCSMEVITQEGLNIAEVVNIDNRFKRDGLKTISFIIEPI